MSAILKIFCSKFKLSSIQSYKARFFSSNNFSIKINPFHKLSITKYPRLVDKSLIFDPLSQNAIVRFRKKFSNERLKEKSESSYTCTFNRVDFINHFLFLSFKNRILIHLRYTAIKKKSFWFGTSAKNAKEQLKSLQVLTKI